MVEDVQDTESTLEQDEFSEQLREDLREEEPAREETVETQKFLTFVLDREEYGVGILKVREIIGYMEVTPVPQTPDFVQGVINLRGQVIPVISLRRKFGMPRHEVTDETCIIVVEVKMFEEQEDEVQMGIVVDTVREVLDIPENNIEPAPTFGQDLENEYIRGMGKIEDDVKILLDIDRVLSEQELVAIEEISED